MKTWKTLSKETEYVEALSEVLASWRALPATQEYKEREALLILIKEYEDKYVNISKAQL